MKKSKEKRTIERKEEERSIWYPTAAEGIKKISFHTNPLLLSPTSSIFICWPHSGALLYEIPVKFLVLPGPSYHTSFRWFPLLLSLENYTWTHCNSWRVTPFPKIFIYPHPSYSSHPSYSLSPKQWHMQFHFVEYCFNICSLNILL